MIQPVVGSDSPADVHLDAVAVAVQPSALVAVGHERQPVRRLEGELLEDLRRGACDALDGRRVVASELDR